MCSIEALYFFFKELQDAGALTASFAAKHAFDDLLWYFAHEHALVHARHAAKRQRREEGAAAAPNAEVLKRQATAPAAAHAAERS